MIGCKNEKDEIFANIGQNKTTNSAISQADNNDNFRFKIEISMKFLNLKKNQDY